MIRHIMPQKFTTVADALSWAEKAFLDADLFYGHGTDNAWDDAVALLIYVLNLSPDVSETVLQQVLTEQESQQLANIFQRRIDEQMPVPYLTQQTWFCGLPFYVDERVIIPRSPIGELIVNQFSPWINADAVHTILDLCCGSACIAIACSYAFPEAKVDAVDLSSDALEVAKINIEKHALEQQVQCIESDVFEQVPLKQYDIIVSNPPYVDADDIASMPKEYHHEPAMALASGMDGLDVTRRILAKATNYLSEQGILIIEVGNSAPALETAFPKLPFTWLEFEYGGDGVFMLTKQQLQAWQQENMATCK